ncbi:MAG: hypothetical protein NTX64_02625 [Elusimicrobia bacterium]|nr:hypothetical protein [Elusimicrobiota bacterium]
MADIQQTNDALIELQRHLEGVRTAAQQINDAKTAVSTSVAVADRVSKDMTGVTRSSNALLERIGAILTKIDAANMPALSSNIMKVLDQMRLTGPDSTATLIEQVLQQVRAGGREPTARLIEQILAQVRATGGDPTAKQILQQVTAGGRDSTAKLEQILQQVRSSGGEPTANLIEQILAQAQASDYKVQEIASTLKWLRWTVVGIAAAVAVILLRVFLPH